MKKFEKIIRVYWWPFIITLSAIFIGVNAIDIAFLSNNTLGQKELLQIEVMVSALATSIGIFVPLLISRNWKKADDRRIYAFTLGLYWTELRKNRFVLEQIGVNFKFNQLLKVLKFKDSMKMLLGKYKFVHTMVLEIKNESFVSSQSSGSISTFDDDNLYNDVLQAYENIANFRLASVVTFEALKMKDWLINYSPDEITQEEEVVFQNEISDALISTTREFRFCKNRIDKAIIALDKKLTEMHIVPTEEVRILESINEIP